MDFDSPLTLEELTPQSQSILEFIIQELVPAPDPLIHLQLHKEEILKERKAMFAFLEAPLEFEKTCLLGFLLCLDIALDVGIITRIHPAMTCAFLSAVYFLINVLDIARLYHLIRGFTVPLALNLFVIFHVGFILEKICATFGADLYPRFTLQDLKRKNRIINAIGQTFICILYVLIHSVVIALLIVTFLAALHSRDASFAAIIVSSNFLELKGSFMKKFNTSNALQISCSDIAERFHLFMYCILILLESWHSEASFSTALKFCSVILGSEIIVDWVKHACIVKFNKFPSSIYSSFRHLLCEDSLAFPADPSQHFFQVCRRIGFLPVPLFSVVIFSFKNFHIHREFLFFSAFVLVYCSNLETPLPSRTIEPCHISVSRIKSAHAEDFPKNHLDRICGVE